MGFQGIWSSNAPPLVYLATLSARNSLINLVRRRLANERGVLGPLDFLISKAVCQEMLYSPGETRRIIEALCPQGLPH